MFHMVKNLSHCNIAISLIWCAAKYPDHVEWVINLFFAASRSGQITYNSLLPIVDIRTSEPSCLDHWSLLIRLIYIFVQENANEISWTRKISGVSTILNIWDMNSVVISVPGWWRLVGCYCWWWFLRCCFYCCCCWWWWWLWRVGGGVGDMETTSFFLFNFLETLFIWYVSCSFSTSVSAM